MYSLSVSAQAANLVVNGSFEGATYTDAWGNVVGTGWILSGPNPDTLSNCNVDSAVNASIELGPQDGSHYVRFQSTAMNGTRDCLVQYIDTVAGQQYTVSFRVAITSTSVGNYSGLEPVWDEWKDNNTDMGADQFYFSPTNTGPVAYQFFSFTETASSSQTRLAFHAIDVNGSILLDNVVVEPITAPPAIAPSLSLVGFQNNQFSFKLTGTTGSNYIVQATTSISAPSWISLRTNSAPFTYIETNADLFRQRFYRGVVAP